MFLESFELPDVAWEEGFLNNNIKMKMTCYSTVYPFKLFPAKKLTELCFEPVTLLYGSNGSGKSTLLNIIAQKISAQRGTYFNRSAFLMIMSVPASIGPPGIIPKNRCRLRSSQVMMSLIIFLICAV